MCLLGATSSSQLSHSGCVLLQQPLRSLGCAQGWKHLQRVLPGWEELAQNRVNQAPVELLAGTGTGNQQRDQKPENQEKNKQSAFRRHLSAQLRAGRSAPVPPKCWARSCPKCPQLGGAAMGQPYPCTHPHPGPTLPRPSREPACPRCRRSPVRGPGPPPPPLLVLQ